MDTASRARSLGARLARARERGQDTHTIERDLAAAKIELAIRRQLATAPPLTAKQRAHLYTVLGGAA